VCVCVCVGEEGGKAAVRVEEGVEASDVTLFSKSREFDYKGQFENMVVFEGPYVRYISV